MNRPDPLSSDSGAERIRPYPVEWINPVTGLRREKGFDSLEDAYAYIRGRFTKYGRMNGFRGPRRVCAVVGCTEDPDQGVTVCEAHGRLWPGEWDKPGATVEEGRAAWQRFLREAGQ